MKTYVFLANGFEEVEALTAVDILRRGGVEVVMVSMQGTREAVGSHGINVKTDASFAECSFDDADALVIPGGMPGTRTLDAHEGLRAAYLKQFKAGKIVAAICAAPSVLGHLGILEGRKAVCYPGFEEELEGATVLCESAVVDGNVITGRSMGAATDFALALLKELCGKEAADKVEKGLYR